MLHVIGIDLDIEIENKIYYLFIHKNIAFNIYDVSEM